MLLHVFAAVFGMSASRVLHSDNTSNTSDTADNSMQPSARSPTKTSNTFSLLGTFILWVFWPSFMASGARPGQTSVLTT